MKTAEGKQVILGQPIDRILWGIATVACSFLVNKLVKFEDTMDNTAQTLVAVSRDAQAYEKRLANLEEWKKYEDQQRLKQLAKQNSRRTGDGEED